VVFPFHCYLEPDGAIDEEARGLDAIEVNVLVHGDYQLTLHRERVSLPQLLPSYSPEGRSEQYVVYAVLDGDGSLRRRPVARIIEPLRSMGAVVHARRGDSLPPLTVVGRTPLRAIDAATPVPSAQVKSATSAAYGWRGKSQTSMHILRVTGISLSRTRPLNCAQNVSAPQTVASAFDRKMVCMFAPEAV
jgi:hypothetical protein